jgi:LytS/YehU family sensor histidine kinase
MPPLMLQPLIENALHHGLGGRAGTCPAVFASVVLRRGGFCE